jgi:hypothetical protein
MAQDLGLDFAAGPSVTLLSADVTDGNAGALTSAVDFGTPGPVEFGYELILTMLSGTVTGSVALRVYWSHDNSDFPDVGSGHVVASNTNLTASADNKIVGSYPVAARYAKFDILNNSGGASVDGTASNTALVLTDIFLDQA